jgi:hypothetical protein
MVVAAVAGTYAGQGAEQPGRATGALTVGSFTFRMAHAYAFAEKAGQPGQESYRVLLTEKPLTAAILKLATTAGASEEHRQELVLGLAEQGANGIEAVVAADKTLLRVNVYGPDFAMGLTLIDRGQSQLTTMDARTISGKLFSENARADARIGGKTIEYDATFSAPIQRAAGPAH